jgi:hypothetical protein
MAIFKSPFISHASGSVGGMTFSHNRGGMYLRRRAMPTNPNTPQQQAVRAAFAQLSILWQDVLTPVERAAWETYADNVPLKNAQGDNIFVTGLNMYIRSNVSRLTNALARVDTAPVVFNLGEYTAPSFLIDTANDELDTTFDNTDAWANEDGSGLIIYGSAPNDPTISYFKGPYRLIGRVDGDSVVPPVSPVTSPLGHVIAIGQRAFFRTVVSRADGRLSYPFLGNADAA